MSRKILEYSLAAFLIALTLTLLLVLAKASDAYRAYESHLAANQQQVERAAGAIAKLADKFSATLDEQAKAQRSVLATLEKSNAVAYEIGLAAAARFLEEQGAIEFDNSVEIIQGAIAKLEQADPRLGMLAKALHKASRR